MNKWKSRDRKSRAKREKATRLKGGRQNLIWMMNARAKKERV